MAIKGNNYKLQNGFYEVESSNKSEIKFLISE